MNLFDMRLKAFFGIALAITMLPIPRAGAAERTPGPYLTITRYPHLTPDEGSAFDEDIGENSVFRIPKWNRICVSLMREVTEARADWEIPEPTKDCDSHLRDFLWGKRDAISTLWDHNSFDGNNIDNQDIYPTVFVARLNGKGRLGLITRDWHGGSGGYKLEWSIYTIRENGRDSFNLPERPTYRGTEFHPGGNVWDQTHCTGYTNTMDCARRLFYPPQDAVRLVFDRDEVRNESVAATEALPLEEGE